MHDLLLTNVRPPGRPGSPRSGRGSGSPAGTARWWTAAGISVAERAGNLLRAYVAAGTSHIRSHVDVDTVAGLTSLLERASLLAYRSGSRGDEDLAAALELATFAGARGDVFESGAA